MPTPSMFMDPEKTFSVSLVWNETTQMFDAIPPQEGEIVFELATSTHGEVHKHLAALSGLPRTGSSLDYSETERVVWGDKERGMRSLVIAVHNGPPAPFRPIPRLTLSLAKIIREECGLQPKEVPAEKNGKPSTVVERIPSEGNSDSPSSSALGSTPSPASGAPIQNPAQG